MIGYWIATMRCGCLDKGTSEWLDSPKVGADAYCTEHGVTDYVRIEAHN